MCCRYTTTPSAGRAYAFQTCLLHGHAPSCVVICGSPESRTQRHPVISRVWATGPRLPFARRRSPSVSSVGFGWHALRHEGHGGRPRHAFIALRDVPPTANVSLYQVGMAGLEPASPCSQSTWVRRYPTSRCRLQSERADLNRRSSGPQPDAIPGFATFCLFISSPYRSRTGLFAVKGRRPRTDRRTGLASAHIFHAVDSCSCAHLSRSRPGGVRIRVCGFSGRRYTISATDPTKNQQKKPDVLMTPGFRYSQFVRPSVTCAMDNRRAYSPDDRRTVLWISIFV